MPADLPRRVAAATQRARDSGALEPIVTILDQREVDGLPFQLRILSGPEAGEGASRTRANRSGRNPFLNPEPNLRVCALGADYQALLNKYPVVRDHLLIVTRHFIPQRSPLTRADFTVLLEVMAALPGLGFYNGGPLAGASQSHRHLQLIPEASLGPLPLEIWLRRGRPLPFGHCRTALPEAGVEDRVRVLDTFYRDSLAAWGYHPDGEGLLGPYNLLVARHWAFWIPRTRAAYRGIPVNGLGFAGALLLRERTPPAWLLRDGIAPVLAAVSG